MRPKRKKAGRLADCTCGAWMTNGTAHKDGCPGALPGLDISGTALAGDDARNEPGATPIGFVACWKLTPEGRCRMPKGHKGRCAGVPFASDAVGPGLAVKAGSGVEVRVTAADGASFERVLSSPEGRAAVEKVINRTVRRQANEVLDRILNGRGPRPSFDDAHLKLIHRMTYLGWEPSDEVVPRREIRSALDAYFGSDRAHLKGTGVR